MAELFENFAVSTLASGVSIGATSLSLQTGHGDKFPSPSGSDFFRVFLFNISTAEHEFVVVSSRSGDILTCNPITKAYNSGDACENRTSKEFFNSLNVTSTQVQSGEFNTSATDTGAADAYVFEMSPEVVLLADNMSFELTCANNNSGGPCTLKIDSLPATSVFLPDGSDPYADSIVAGVPSKFIYDGTNFILRSPVSLLKNPISKHLLSLVYPVGAIFMSVNNVSPQALFGGTWETIRTGRVLISEDGTDYTAGDTGGSKDAVVVSHDHTFTGDALADHTHGQTIYAASSVGGSIPAGFQNVSANHTGAYDTQGESGGTPSGTISTDGVSGTDANMPPYLAVYMWKRTA